MIKIILDALTYIGVFAIGYHYGLAGWKQAYETGYVDGALGMPRRLE